MESFGDSVRESAAAKKALRDAALDLSSKSLDESSFALGVYTQGEGKLVHVPDLLYQLPVGTTANLRTRRCNIYSTNSRQLAHARALVAPPSFSLSASSTAVRAEPVRRPISRLHVRDVSLPPSNSLMPSLFSLSLCFSLSPLHMFDALPIRVDFDLSCLSQVQQHCLGSEAHDGDGTT